MDWIQWAVGGVVSAIGGHFAKAILIFLTDRTVFRRKLRVDVSGPWNSTFTWQGGRVEHDVVEVKQTGRSVSGKSTIGTFKYEFKGRFFDDTLLIGEWRGLVNPLLGPFLLRVDPKDNKKVSGYWIGNGTDALFRGEWKWDR